MKTLIIILAAALIVPQMANAQDLVPATSEDIEQFDEQLGLIPDDRPVAKQEQKKDKKAKTEKERKENFGAIVSAEAKRLKEAGEDKKGFGQWVSEQRKKDDQKGQGAGKDKSGDVGKDARASDPSQGNASGKDKAKDKKNK